MLEYESGISDVSLMRIPAHISWLLLKHCLYGSIPYPIHLLYVYIPLRQPKPFALCSASAELHSGCCIHSIGVLFRLLKDINHVCMISYLSTSLPNAV